MSRRKLAPEADHSICLRNFSNIFPDSRPAQRVLFMLGILAVYRLGAWIPTPGVNTAQLELSSASRTAPCSG